MKRILFILITVGFLAGCSSLGKSGKKEKVFNGKIVYEMSYDGDNLTPVQLAQMPKTMEISTMEGRMKRETIMGAGSQAMIVNEEFKVMYTLLDFGTFGRFVIRTPFDSIPKQDSADKLKEWKEDIMVTEETKTIAEVVCKKAVVTETKEGEDDRMYNMFYSPELGVWPQIQLHADEEPEPRQVNGVPLEFVEYQGDVKVTYKAIEVKKGGLKDLDFMKPSDFKEVTMKELQEMMSGGQ